MVKSPPMSSGSSYQEKVKKTTTKTKTTKQIFKSTSASSLAAASLMLGGSGKVISIGSDFSGLGSQSITMAALAKCLPFDLRFSLNHVFACDKLKASKKIIKESLVPPTVFFDDVADRRLADMNSVDFYQYTAPCQGLSTAGKRGGENDARTQLIFHSVSARHKAWLYSF